MSNWLDQYIAQHPAGGKLNKKSNNQGADWLTEYISQHPAVEKKVEKNALRNENNPFEVQGFIPGQKQKNLILTEADEIKARNEGRVHDQTSQKDASYYTEKVDYAIEHGDYKAAKNWMDKMVHAPLTSESRQIAQDYINNLYENKGTWGEAAKSDAEKAADRILDAYDRGADNFAELMTSEEGQQLAKTVEQEFGVKYDTNAMKDPTQYISDLKGDTDSGAYWTFANGQTGFLNQNAYTDFVYRAYDEFEKASKHETSSVQMDSYVRAQTAYTVLDKLYNYLDVGGNAAGVSVNDTTAKYLIAELKQYGVDLSGMTEENYREWIQSAMEQQSYKARMMRSVLQQEGFDTEAVRQYTDYLWNQMYEQDRGESMQEWAKNASAWDKAAATMASYGENVWLSGYNTLGTYARLLGMSGKDDDPNRFVPATGSNSNAEAVQSAVGQSMGNVGGFFYGVGNSMIESTLRNLSFGAFNPALGWIELPKGIIQAMTLSQMGINVAGSTANQILQRGGNSKQAMIGGLASGAIEALTEIASLEIVLDKIKTTDSFLGWLEGIGLSAVAEGSEEGASNILNLIVDAANMGNLSENDTAIQKYLDQGLTLEEAQARVLQENVIALAQDMGAGALSGGGEGIIAGAAGYAKNKGTELWYNMTDKNGNYKHIKFFNEQQQKNADEAAKAMLGYSFYYLGGNKEQLRASGLSEKEANQALKDYERIQKEYAQITGSEENQTARADKNIPAGVQTAQRAETMNSSAPVKGVIGDVDSNTFIPEKAAEDAQATLNLYERLDSTGELKADRSTAQNMVRIATVALTNIQNAQAFGRMKAEDGYAYELALKSVIEATNNVLQTQTAQGQNQEIRNTAKMPAQESAPANNNIGGNENVTENSYDGSKRKEGMGADGEGGAVPQSTEVSAKRGRNDALEIRRAVSAGQADQRSPKSLGIKNGSKSETMQVLHEDVVNRIDSLRSISEKAAKEGAKVVFYTGTCEVFNKSTKQYFKVEGIYSNETDTYYIKADRITRSAEQVFLHELLHRKIRNNPKMLLDAAEELAKTYSKEELDRLVDQYCEAYHGIYGIITEDMSADEAQDVYMKYIEEICADAYAGIRRGSINTVKAERVMETYRTDTQKQTKAATERTNGPNEQRYSFAGTKAEFADMSALEKAKAMEEENASSEEIRQQTGWFKGYDGKWRFEINDEDMKLDLKGNLMSNPDVRRYNELFEKAYLYDTAKESELKELQILEKNLEGVRKTPKYLGEYVQHDALFKSYPELKNIEVVFVENKGDADGAYHPGFNEIVLKRNLRLDQKRLKSVLIHEIQHAIQNIEGFAEGASVSYWNEQRESNRVNDDRSSRQLYFDTSGEIEARDVQSRMDMTAEQRKNTRPDIDRTDAVFADYSSGERLAISSDADYLSIAEKYRDGTATEEETEQLRKMVDEAAKKAMPNTKVVDENGNPRVVYHQSPTNFNIFKRGVRDGLSGRGIYFSYYGESFGTGNVIRPFFVNVENPITHDVLYDNKEELQQPNVFGKFVRYDGQIKQDALYTHDEYDGVMIRSDEVVVKDSAQIKSADLVTYDDNGNIIPLSERFDSNNDDIRYSVEDDTQELDEEYRRAVERDAAENEPKEKGVSFLPEREHNGPDYGEMATEEIERRAKEATLPQLRNMQKSSEAELNRYRWAKRKGILTEEMEKRMKTVEETVKIQSEELKHKNAEERKAREKRKLEEAEQQKPRIAKKELKAKIAEIFSIPAGMRKMSNDLIENAANQILQNGFVSEEDRASIRNALIKAGVVNVAPEGYFGEIRNYVQHGRIYVPESVRIEFGDDWEAFRKDAWANRIYLTNDSSDIGIDVWNADLAQMFPGGFDEQATDMKEALEQIVALAKEGRAENLTIAEMMERNKDNYGWSIESQMEDLEERFDAALREFADKANLEIKIRQEKAVEVLKERAKFRDMLEREAARKRESQQRNQVMRKIQELNRMRKRAAPEIKAQIDELLKDIDTVARSISDRGLEELHDLAKAYYTEKENNPNFIPNPYVESRLERLQNMQLDDMEIKDVIELGRAVSALAKSIQDANKLMSEEYDADIKETAESAISEMRATKGSKGGKLYKWAVENHLSPVRFIRHLGGWLDSGAMDKIAKSLENGQTRQMGYLMKASHIFDAFISEKENQKWMQKASGKNAEWIKVSVPVDYDVNQNDQTEVKFQEIEITPMMRVALYMHSLNYDNLRHIQGGGITIPDKARYIAGNIKDAYAYGTRVKMRPETVRAIVKDCTAEERAFAKLLQQYYNEFSKDRINEVSMTLDGFERAGGDNYYHIKVDKNFLSKLPETVAKNISLESIGSIVNERVFAENPIVLEDASVSLADHMEQISKYYGFAVPIRDFGAIMNYTVHEKGNAFAESVKDVMGRQWGSGAQEYLNKLMKDLQSATGVNDMAANFFKNLRGKLAGASLMFNPAVAVSQMASYPGAMQTLGADALVHGLKFWEKVNTELIEKYSPLLWYRNQGNSTQELGDYMDGQTIEHKLPWLLGWIQKMDSATVRRLWAASEYYVSKNTDLKPGSEAEIAAGTDEYYQKVAEYFNRAVYDTQPNYSTMQRPQILRSESDLMKFLTMFKTVPLQYYNMMFEATGKLEGAKRRGNAEEIKSARKFFARTTVGVLSANAIYVAIKAFFKGLKFRDKDYRDENGKLTFESIVKQLGLDFLETCAGSIIGGAELLDVIERIIAAAGGEKQQYSGTEINAISFAASVVQDVLDLANGIGELDGKDIASGIKNITKDGVMGVFGLPAENVETYLLALTKWISPEFAERYSNLFEDRKKESLSEESGRYLEAAISVYMDNRTEDLPDEVKSELQSLWVDGQKTVIPSAVPNSISVNGENVDLSPSQKKQFKSDWRDIVSQNLAEVMKSEYYQNADNSTKAKMIDRVYRYANQVAKSNLGIGFEEEPWVQNADQERLTDYLVYATMESTLDRESRTEEQNLAAVTAIMEYVLGGMSDDDCEEITRLYMDGADGLIPKLAPNEIKYNDDSGVEHTVTLDADARAKYQETWRNIIGDQLSTLMGSDEYAKTDDKTRASMISKTLDFASEAAKAEAAPERTVDNWITNGLEDMEDGITLSDYIIYRTEFSQINGKNEDGESENGLKKQRTLDLIDSHAEWNDAQKISVFLDNCGEGDAELVPKMQSAGFTWNQIRSVVKETSKAGKKKALLNSSASNAAKMKILPEMLDSNETMDRYHAAVMFGVNLKHYAEVITNADADESGRISQNEATEYIKSMALPIQDAAYLWQMVTDAKNGKKNPFGREWGAQFYFEVHKND